MQRKKLVATSCAAIALVASWVGATASSSSAAAKGNISFITSSTQKVVWEDAKARFEKANPGVSMNIQYVPFVNLGTQIRTQIAAGNSPDLILSAPGSSILNSVLPLARQNSLLDLSKSPWVKNVFSSAKGGVTLKGKTYGWPIYAVPAAAIYRKSAFKAAGIKSPPATFSEFIAACAKAKAAGKYLFSANLLTGSSAVATGFVTGSDPKWIAKRRANKVKFATSKVWKTALARYVTMQQKGCLGPSPGTVLTTDSAIRSFINGSALSTFQPYQSIPIFTAGGVPTSDLGSFPFPVDKKPGVATLAITYSLSIPAKAKNPAAAKAFIDFVATKQASRRAAKIGIGISPYDVKKNKFVSQMNTPLFKAALKKKRYYQPIGIEFQNPTVQVAFNNGLQQLFNGGGSIDGTLKAMDAAWDS